MAWRSQTPALARGVTIAAPQRKVGGLRAPPTAAPPGPARCAAQGRGAATPASARPGSRVGTGWAEGKKGPTTLRGAFFGRAPTAQKINGRVGGTAQGGRSPRACAAWPCAGPPVSNPPLPRRACGAFMPGLGPPVPRTAARRVGGCAGGPDRRSRGRSGPNGGPGYRSARKGRRRAATPAQGGKGVRGERACRAAARGPPSCAELAGDYAKRTRKNPEPFGPGSFPLVQLAPPRRCFFIIPHRLRFVKPACHCAGPPAAASAGPRDAHPPPRGRAGGGGSLPSVRCPLAAAIAGRPALACGPLPSQFTEK